MLPRDPTVDPLQHFPRRAAAAIVLLELLYICQDFPLVTIGALDRICSTLASPQAPTPMI